MLWLSEIFCEFVIEYIDHRIELAYAQYCSQCVASGAMQSAHSNKHNNDNFQQVYQTEIDMKVTLKTGTARLAGTAIAGKCKVIDPVDDINYGILKSSPW